MRSGFAPLLAGVLAAGIAAFALETDDFRVVTSEGARRLEVERAPRALPAVSLIDQDGAAFALADYRGRVVLVEFIYTGCAALCGVLGDEFRRAQDRIRRDHVEGRISLLSISFDVARDGPAELQSYAKRFGAEAPGWRIAVPTAAELPMLLRSFGVVVIPDGAGGFIHNAAISVVDREGRLARILDPGAVLAQLAPR